MACATPQYQPMNKMAKEMVPMSSTDAFMCCDTQSPVSQESIPTSQSDNTQQSPQVNTTSHASDSSTFDYKSIPPVLLEHYKKYLMSDSSPLDKYTYISDLGKGAFGHVSLMYNREIDECEAIKFIKLDKVYNIQDEIENHSKVNGHPNIISFKSMFVVEDRICVVMEYAKSGDLFTKLHNSIHHVLDEDVARNYFKQLVSAVDYCHEKGVCHRDIKLENILLHGNVLKLCDFGYSIDANSNDNKRVGTPYYMAPEVIKSNMKDLYKLDTWACGVVLYCLTHGIYPFEDSTDPKNLTKHLRNIVSGNYIVSSKLSNECADLFKHIFVVDHEQRYNTKQILSHPWLS